MKKDYYIQGDPARAEEIKAAFEERGCTLYRLASNCDSEDLIYYSLNGIVRGIKKDNLYLFEAHPGYKELPLPVKSNSKFKPGTWLWHKTKGVFPLMVEDYDEKEGYLMLMQYPESKCYFGSDIIENDYRLWEISDARNGDVLVVNGSSKEYKWIGIFKALTSDTSFSSHCHYNCGMCEFVTHIARCTKHGTKYNDIRPATNEERDLLFAKMREAGYTWDENKKELKKFPKKHYDISSFHAGMPVLVRADNVCRWNYSVFSHITGNKDWQFAVCNGVSFTQCIPFEGNETLLGTSDMCNERFVNW